ncbi:hypothetical protein ACJA23_03360 [Mycoplasma corogypsi]|uniref:hypothetical protein n=1 Tax=Mycoplasma corogypsi TaxID=2106 RepID=UPI003873AAA8
MLKRSEYSKFNSVPELWKHEKDTFRFWIVGLLVSFILLIFINILISIFSGIRIAEQLEPLVQEGIKKFNFNEQQAATFRNNVLIEAVVRYIIQYIVLFGIYGFALHRYVSSLIKSYKAQDFSLLSRGVFMFAFFIGIWSLMNIIVLLTRDSSDIAGANWQYKVIFALNIIALAVAIVNWLLFSNNVKAIYVAFATIRFNEQMLEMQQKFNEMVQNGQNPFAPFAQGMPQVNLNNEQPNDNLQNNTQATTSQTEQELENKKEKAELNKLLSLPNEQLFSIAKKLKIFGYETMEREELAQTIINTLKVTNKDK